MAKRTIEVPPFPTLTWDHSFWTADDVLPSWAGAEDRSGPYSSRSGDAPSTGRVKLFIRPPGDSVVAPSSEQIAAYQFLKQNDAVIAEAALKAIFDRYPEWKESYGYDDEEAAELMPALAAPEDLRRLVGLGTAHILNIAKDGHAYYGLELGCSWDDEHGVGVLFQKGRVIDVGQADTSFNVWPAKDDGGAELES
jgi:hypothetical protein